MPGHYGDETEETGMDMSMPTSNRDQNDDTATVALDMMGSGEDVFDREGESVGSIDRA